MVHITQWKTKERQTRQQHTSNFGMLSTPGKSSMSPLLTEKQAPCHGHRISPPHNTPNRQARILICTTTHPRRNKSSDKI